MKQQTAKISTHPVGGVEVDSAAGETRALGGRKNRSIKKEAA